MITQCGTRVYLTADPEYRGFLEGDVCLDNRTDMVYVKFGVGPSMRRWASELTVAPTYEDYVGDTVKWYGDPNGPTQERLVVGYMTAPPGLVLESTAPDMFILARWGEFEEKA